MGVNLIYAYGICVFAYFMGPVYSLSAQSCQGVVVSGKCLLFQGKNEIRTWQEAKTHCESLNARLASIPDAETQKWFEERMVAEGVTQIWTGGNEALDMKWKWVADGRPIRAQGCYGASPSGSGNPVLNKQIPVTPLTPEKCIKACKDENYPYAAVQAGSICSCKYTQDDGPMQSNCSTPCEGDRLQSCGGLENKFVYIVEGAWSKWKENQPSDFNGYQQCVALDSAAQFKFAAKACESENNYICDLPQHKCLTGVTVQGSNSCYFLSGASKRWYQAQEDCIQRGGHLVTLYGEADWTELKQLIETYASGPTFHWIGLNRRNLTWADGEPIKFTKWADSSPDDNAHNCIMVDKTEGCKWVDAPCSSQYAFFCESAITTPANASETRDSAGPATN